MSDTPPAQPWADYGFPASDFDRLRRQEQAAFARMHAADDAARAASGTTAMVAIAGFTVINDPDKPEGLVVQPGQEFTIPTFDVPRYAGRALPK